MPACQPASIYHPVPSRPPGNHGKRHLTLDDSDLQFNAYHATMNNSNNTVSVQCVQQCSPGPDQFVHCKQCPGQWEQRPHKVQNPPPAQQLPHCL